MDLSYEARGTGYTGYLVGHTSPSAKPGVLVFHGGGGLGQHARERAEMIADLGYVAFAADLFGESVDDVEHARALTSDLTKDWPELRARCEAALAALRRQPNVDANRIAAIGFCFGGQVAIELGRSGADLRAMVGFHSRLVTARPQDSRHGHLTLSEPEP